MPQSAEDSGNVRAFDGRAFEGSGDARGESLQTVYAYL